MIPVDDPRHGTYAGAAAHWAAGESPCVACQPEATRVRKVNRYLAATGRPSHIPAIGTVRRIHALQALGYSLPALERETGVSADTLHNPTWRGTLVRRTTADAVAAAYERLCMTHPSGGYAHRSRRAAARKGWAPPLAWDDDTIDDPDAEPAGIEVCRNKHCQSQAGENGLCDDHRDGGQSRTGYDEARVELILSGRWRMPGATPEEKREVARRYYRCGGHLEELARLTGWNIPRYYKASEAAA